MASIFDGMAGLLSDVFGSPIIHTSADGSERTITGIFRGHPVDLSEEDGHTVLEIAPTLRVTSQAAVGILVGDRILPTGAAVHRVLNRIPSGSPASDAFVIFELELSS